MVNLNTLFWVRSSSANKNGFAPLMIRITISADDLVNFSTGITVNPKEWNVDKKLMKGKSEESARVNNFISTSKSKLQSIFDNLRSDEKYISAELIKNVFQGKTQERITILKAITDHNERLKNRIEIEDVFSGSTLVKYEKLSEKLSKFMASTLGKDDVFINEVNYSFIEDFKTWLLQNGHVNGSGLSADTATGILKRLHKITTYLFKRGYLKNDPFLDINLSWQDPTAEGLTEDQLQALENLKLTKPKLQIILDRFIVGCYTGLSHSDLSAVSRDNIIKNFADDSLWISIKRKKTDNACKIPILPPVQTIIDKYSNNPHCIATKKLFPSVPLNTLNNNLKKIGALAGIKNVNLSSHKSRHTCSQILMDAGVNIEAISQILGHSSSATTKKIYAKASFKFVSGEIQAFKEKKYSTSN